MSVAGRSVGEAFVAVAGRDAVRDDERARAAAAVDGLLPRWVVRPASLEQVSQVMALAHEAGLAVAPRGSGSSLELGRSPARMDVALDLRGLDRVVEYNPADVSITVEAGITAGALAARLAPHRQFLALDPPGAATRTLGGITATNASGPLRARYGTMRDLLLGVRFVQADGVVTWGGSKVVKSVSGYDVPKLMVGALGTLGVLGELTLRLHPLPEAKHSWLVRLTSAEAAQRFVERVVDSSLQPNRLEFFSGGVLETIAAGPAVAGVGVSIGSVETAVVEGGERLAALAKAEAAEIAAVPDTFWSDAERALTPSHGEALLQVASLTSRLATTQRAIGEAMRSAAPQAGVWTSCCAPLGAIRARLGAADVAEMAAVITRLRAELAEIGGSVVIARGPSALRAAVDPWGPIDAGPFALMQTLKDDLDPRRALNPGRFVGGL
jgi:glycolate oxidase FAD binding subunit